MLRATAPVSVNGKPSKAKYETEAKVVQEARARVAALCDKFPVYPEIDLSIVERYGTRWTSRSRRRSSDRPSCRCASTCSPG